MVIDLYYPDLSFHYKVNIGKDEYVEYLWEKEIGKKFHPMYYFLEPLGKETYNKLEEQWMKNKLPLFEIRQEDPFKNFLLDRFEYEAKSKQWEDEEYKPYIMLSEEELEEIFLENFMGEV